VDGSQQRRRQKDLILIFAIAFFVVACGVAAVVAYLALSGDDEGSTTGSSDAAATTLGPEDTTDASGPITTGPDGTAEGTGTTGTGPEDTGGSTSSTAPEETTTTAAEPIDLSPLATLAASSTLETQGSVDYSVANLVDGDPATCWAEGVEGYGLGEHVQFDFPSPVTVTQISIIPGYDKNVDGWDRWFSNGRVRTFDLSFSDGATESYSVSDSRDLKTITLSTPHTVTWVRFTITGVFSAEEGPKQAEDTSVSELLLLGTE
jgi:hypothetical protein